jgi:hydroxymethylpyrimidine kinase / phosphomethylpyrimidine kinase / thiamine-phosphate diphosphorylase
MSPRVWSVAGMDPSGYAGSQVDVATLKNLGVSACSVLTAVTAQNAYHAGEIHYLPAAHVQAQIKMLQQQESPAVIKIGMLGSCDLHHVLSFLKDYSGKVVLDPVLHSSSGTALYEGDGKTYVLSLIQLFPWVDILTPNISEAEQLLGRTIASTQEVEQAAKDLVLLGAKSVLLKGGHRDCGLFSQDYWTDGKDAFWLANVRLPQKNYRGTGCTLSSAIAAALALGYSQKDAIVIAKMYVHQAIRLSSDLGANTAQLFHGGWPEAQEDLPYLSPTPLTQLPLPFPKCKTGLYPIVDSSAWVQRLLSTPLPTSRDLIAGSSPVFNFA